MSPPHSMFISESVDGQAKPEPMNEEAYVSRPAQGNTKQESSEDSSRRRTSVGLKP
ncbi:hypothetical protein OS493_014031 [Desmophyllum pertusum]|uniref:Uncharacterized protein n=1 Tax=Desmophyllum pertusum TaxID=174260 RepID=A0A9X0CXX7_9CNID|nr:hypothetical protein OS493_014031 [Desmophyllum pertusum]